MNQPRTPAEPVTPPGELYAIDDVDRRIIALLLQGTTRGRN